MLQNLFQSLPHDAGHEVFEVLVQHPGVKIERIISRGQITARGEWYDQEQAEWVVLLSGHARLRLEGDEPIALAPGDWVYLPAHRRHRVEETSVEPPAIWLAVHLDGEAITPPQS